MGIEGGGIDWSIHRDSLPDSIHFFSLQNWTHFVVIVCKLYHLVIQLRMTRKRILKIKTFNKSLAKLELSDKDLLIAANQIEAGLYEANLGGNLYKKRIAIRNRGKSHGVRTIFATKLSKNIFFLFSFRKNEKVNIDNTELLNLLKISEFLLNLSNDEIRSLLEKNYLFEVNDD